MDWDGLEMGDVGLIVTAVRMRHERLGPAWLASGVNQIA